MTQIKTWRRGSGLMNWTYNLGKYNEPNHAKQLLSDPVQRKMWTVEKIEFLLIVIRGFARVQNVTVDTWSCGEETLIIEEWQGDESRSKFLQFLQATDDVTNIDFTLTLECLKPGNKGNLEELEIESGASIFVFIELDDEGKLDTDNHTPIWFTFSLDVDIYAPFSWGEVRDNIELAQLNSSRLWSFLNQLQNELTVELIDIDAPDYSQNMVVFYHLKQGREHWNRWREYNYIKNPDFRGQDFSNEDLSGYDLNGAIFDYANLANTNFTEAILIEASMVHANIDRANFTRADITRLVISEAKNDRTANFTDAIDDLTVDETNTNIAILT